MSTGSKTLVDYPIVDTAAGVVYMAMANQGSIEFHIWTSRNDLRAAPGSVAGAARALAGLAG